jgi:hypothetical protein
MVCKDGRQESLAITQVLQKWRFSTPQTHLWLIKVWFSASIPIAIGMVKIATFAKPENVSINHPFSITTLSPTAWHIAIFHTSRFGLPWGS